MPVLKVEGSRLNLSFVFSSTSLRVALKVEQTLDSVTGIPFRKLSQYHDTLISHQW